MAIAVLFAQGAAACGCGGLVGATATSEKALVIFGMGRETIVPGLSINRVGPTAAVVFPVPARPEIRALQGGLHLFSQLEDATVPQRRGGATSSGTASPGPSATTKEVGGYTVTTLRGGTGGTLERWLTTHRYALKSGSAPILDNYTARGWYFVAIRIADTATSIDIRPLTISFRVGDHLVYPMRFSRLARDPLDLELFVNSPTGVALSGLRGLNAEFTGNVATLRPRPSRRVRGLLRWPTLTRFDAYGVSPRSIGSDVSGVGVTPA